MSSRGPGGRIPNQGNPPAAKGVGRNAKRHDLERQNTPGLAGSDLQQGDVGALEQGQRVAPIRTQPDAVPGQAQQAQRQGQPTPDVDLTDMKAVIQGAAGGTAPTQPQQQSGNPDMGKQSRARAWIGFHTQLASQPSASPLYRAAVHNQIRQTIDAASYAPEVGGALFLDDVDTTIEKLKNAKPPTR